MRKTLPISLKPHWGTSALKLISFITVILFFSTNSLIAQELIEIYLIASTYLDISSIGGLLTLSRTSGRCAHRVKKYVNL